MIHDVAETASPFPGLRAFREEDSPYFFGRDSTVADILRRLSQRRLLAILGPSGSGKSSLIHAGVIPAIRSGQLYNESPVWRVATCRPGVEPIRHLAEALTIAGFDDAEPSIRRSSRGLLELAGRAGSSEGRLLLVVDQFEELFRLAAGPTSDERDLYASLLALVAEPNAPMHVILTMRADFVGALSTLPALPEALGDGLFLMPRMSREQMRATVVYPIRLVGADIEPWCVQRLLNDGGDAPDTLFRLQHVLMRTFQAWQRRGPDVPVGIADYESAGAIGSALDLHAEEVYGALDLQQRRATEVLFKLLFTEEGHRVVRRPTPLREVAAVTGLPEDIVAGVVDRFSAAGFINTSPVVAGSTVIDVTHEGLHTGWSRLSGWISEEIESRDEYLQLVYRAERQSRLTGRDLANAVDWWREHQPNSEWSARYGGEFDKVRGFLESSRRASLLRRGLVIAGLFALTLLSLLTIAWWTGRIPAV